VGAAGWSWRGSGGVVVVGWTVEVAAGIVRSGDSTSQNGGRCDIRIDIVMLQLLLSVG